MNKLIALFFSLLLFTSSFVACMQKLPTKQILTFCGTSAILGGITAFLMKVFENRQDGKNKPKDENKLLAGTGTEAIKGVLIGWTSALPTLLALSDALSELYESIQQNH